MRICLVSYEFPPDVGGEASYTWNLANGLVDIGHQVTVITSRRNVGSPRPVIHGLGVVRVETSRLPLFRVASFMIRARKELRRIAQNSQVDVVHFAFDYPSIRLNFAGLGVPIVATVHHLHLAETLAISRTAGSWSRFLQRSLQQAVLTFMEKSLVAQATLTIAVSEFTAKTLQVYLSRPIDRTRIVPNGIDNSEFSVKEAGDQTSWVSSDKSTPTILFVGRLEPSKGIGYLIRATESVKNRVPTIALIIVGRGSASYVSALRLLAESLGLGDSVTFTGLLNQQDLMEAYSSCSMLVLPSLMEGFGITLLEAMATGKPCVATRVGAIPEVVRNGSTGIIVEPADVESLSRAIIFLLDNPADAKLMGKRAREVVNENFTVKLMTKRTEAVYHEALTRATNLRARNLEAVESERNN